MSDDTEPRPLPMCLESEAAVIATILAQKSNPDVAVSELDPSDFMDTTNRVIWKGVVELHKTGMPVDIPAVKDWLTRNGLVGMVDPNDMQRKLALTPYVTDLDQHIQQVRQHSRLRALMNTCSRIAIEAYDAGGDIETFISESESAVYKSATERSAGKQIHHLRDCIHELFTSIAAEIQARQSGECVSICTGLTQVDRLIGGLRNGELIVIPARPSMGKTALMLNIATHVASTMTTPRVGAHVISLESPRENVAGRVVCAEGKINMEYIRQRKFPDGSFASLTPACATAAKLPITIDERKGLTIAQIRGSVRRAQAELRKVNAAGDVTQRLGLLCIDYLQLVRHTTRSGSREEAVGQIAYELLAMAGEFDLPVIALAQLNRAVESRDDKRPRMSDIRESGAIEQAANIIVALYRDDYYDKNSEDVGICEAIVLKSKDTRTGTARIKFTPEWMRFDNLASDSETENVQHWQETE